MALQELQNPSEVQKKAQELQDNIKEISKEGQAVPKKIEAGNTFMPANTYFIVSNASFEVIKKEASTVDGKISGKSLGNGVLEAINWLV